jgi:ABC-type branched-subunit amino acid transport system substrate-binding protein
MINDLKAFQPNIVLSQPAAAGYLTAEFLIQALKKAGPNLTREALYNAINGGFTFQTGATVPVLWPLGHTFGQSGFVFVQDVGDHFTVPVHLQSVPVINNPAYSGK